MEASIQDDYDALFGASKAPPPTPKPAQQAKPRTLSFDAFLPSASANHVIEALSDTNAFESKFTTPPVDDAVANETARGTGAPSASVIAADSAVEIQPKSIPVVDRLGKLAYDRDLQRQASVRESQRDSEELQRANGGRPSILATIAGMRTRSRLGAAVRPDAGFIERWRTGNQELAIAEFQNATRVLEQSASRFASTTLASRETMVGMMGEHMRRLERAARAAASVVSENSPTSTLHRFQDATERAQRAVLMIDRAAAAKPAAFDRVNAGLKDGLQRCSDACSRIAGALSRLVAPSMK